MFSGTRRPRVAVFQEEFPANHFPWLRLENRGLRITRLSLHDPLDRIAEAIRGARLLAISYVNYLAATEWTSTLLAGSAVIELSVSSLLYACHSGGAWERSLIDVSGARYRRTLGRWG